MISAPIANRQHPTKPSRPDMHVDGSAGESVADLYAVLHQIGGRLEQVCGDETRSGRPGLPRPKIAEAR